MFKIGLHKDDENVLRYIKDKLGTGSVRIYNDESIFNITDQKGIALLIYIFDKYYLNTTKYLDYLDFKNGFLLYTHDQREKRATDYYNRDKIINSEKINSKILELKKNMNTNRVFFDRPTFSKMEITKSWLLGFIEGEGSFFLRRDTLTPIFAIQLSGVQLTVLVKIKEFLENSLGLDLFSLYKLKYSSTIAIINQEISKMGKGNVSLIIKNVRVLNNYFIPFFAGFKFLTKKGKDFNDFKIMCKAVYVGSHRKEDIRSLILKLSYSMNNFRLSTNKVPVNTLSLGEIEKLKYAAATVEYLQDGRVIDRVTKKVLHQKISCVYEIYGKGGVLFLENSLSEAASVVGLYPQTLSKYLDDAVVGVFVEIKNYKVRRMATFLPVK
jgi:hypothetical protein